MYRPQPQQGQAGYQQPSAGNPTPQRTRPEGISALERLLQYGHPEPSSLTPQQRNPPVQARERAPSHQPARSGAQGVPYGQASYSQSYQSYAQQQPSQVPQRFNAPDLLADHNRETLDELVEGCRRTVTFLDEYEPKICHRPTAVWDTDDGRKLLHRLLGDCRQAAAILDDIEIADSYTPMPPQYHLSYQTKPGSSISDLVSYCRTAIKRYKEFLEKRRAPDDNGRSDEQGNTSFHRGGNADSESAVHPERSNSPPLNSIRLIPGLISYIGMTLYNELSPNVRAIHCQDIRTETSDLRRENAELRRHCRCQGLSVPPDTLYERAQLKSGLPSQSNEELYVTITPNYRRNHNQWIADEIVELRRENEALRYKLEGEGICVQRTNDGRSHPLRQFAIRVQHGKLCVNQDAGILEWN